MGPVVAWLKKRIIGPSGVRAAALDRLQLRFKLDQPLQGTADLLTRVSMLEEFGLDVIDYVLHFLDDFKTSFEPPDLVVNELAEVLRDGGSVWEISMDGDAFGLTRRAVGPVREAVESIPPSTRAHQHLVAGWNKLAGRNPDPGGAYREAVRAVEAAGKPIVLPDNDRATLGQMIAAMRDKPEKWASTLGTVDDVRRSMEAVWRGQLDRHGTDDPDVPINASPEEADAAFYTCLNLVRQFVGGHVLRVA